MPETTYRAAKYIRLSYTDDKSVESDSVGNQRKMIDDFVARHPEIEVVSERVDDGYSGIIFERPDFKKMMEDIEAGIVNCVIVKDLSRLGREYIETGRYLRRIFPAYGVRFIAINDNLDTLTDSGDDLSVSVKSIINDAYCRDISVKTRSALNAKRDQGDFVGASTVYGYRKSEENHNQLVLDDYPAAVVRDIFNMKLSGMSALKIAEQLNRIGVLSPLEYKKDRGIPHPKRGYAYKADAKWSAKTIIRILGDETYAGTLIQGKQGTLNYKIKNRLDKPVNEWFRTENAHEPVISRQDFDLVQRVMRLDTRTAPGGDSVYLFSGVLICGSCGGRMKRKTVTYKGRSYFYYNCPTGKAHGCAAHGMMREDDLIAAVLDSVKAHVANVASLDDVLKSVAGDQANRELAARQSAQIAENERQLEKIQGFKAGLYENMIGGILSKDDYKSLKNKYSEDISRLQAAIGELRRELADTLTGNSERYRWVEYFKEFSDIAELDRKTVAHLIQSIRIMSKNEVVITFNYRSEYESAAALLGKGAA
ncbi:MAG: recombinase family protein [Oscillospiraceae bacterium]|jgi:DNA invertase Pin-like site-specific DNA recombinase|nr:recombinase family protein [Oscillospiraceae bacterium]